MHSQVVGVIVVVFLLPFSRVVAKESAEGPASYLDSGAPIVLKHNASLPVNVKCRLGPQQARGDDDAPAASSWTPRSTLKSGDHWSINLESEDEPLLCTFRSALRKWNCDERWFIKDACVWERPRSSVTKPPAKAPVKAEAEDDDNPNPQPQAKPGCPKCESKNSVSKPICVWTIMDDGIHVQTWDAEEKKDLNDLTHPWCEDNPAFYNPTSPFRFSVANHFNNTIKIQCDVVSKPVMLEPSKGPQGPNPKWEYEIHPIIDADYIYFTWTCDFEVVGTMLRRGGVHIWSPQPEVNTWIRTPDCTDCAWKLDSAGLWLDDRSCYTDRPVWIRQHLWDSVLSNTSGTDGMDWSPYYYPLKRSSHVHHIF